MPVLNLILVVFAMVPDFAHVRAGIAAFSFIALAISSTAGVENDRTGAGSFSSTKSGLY
jgi:hypothetical protein